MVRSPSVMLVQSLWLSWLVYQLGANLTSPKRLQDTWVGNNMEHESLMLAIADELLQALVAPFKVQPLPAFT